MITNAKKECNTDFMCVGLSNRVFAVIIDSLIFCPLVLINGFIFHGKSTPYSELNISAVFIAITVFFVAKYGGTPGKLLLGIRIVGSIGNYLKVSKVILRELPTILITTLFIFLDYRSAGNISFLIISIDILPIIFNKKKRAIHDFLANSYVITYHSLKNSKGN